MHETDFLRALKSRNKGPTRNAAISLEEFYIKWLDNAATQAGYQRGGRGQVVRQLIEEKLSDAVEAAQAEPSKTEPSTKTVITLHPEVAKAARRAGGNLSDLVNQALAQALELEVSA